MDKNWVELDVLHLHCPLETSALYGKQGGFVWKMGLGEETSHHKAL